MDGGHGGQGVKDNSVVIVDPHRCPSAGRNCIARRYGHTSGFPIRRA